MSYIPFHSSIFQPMSALRSSAAACTRSYLTSLDAFLFWRPDIVFGTGIPGKVITFSLFQRVMTTPGAHPASYVQDSRVAGSKLTTHRHLEPKLRMSGAIPPLPQTSSLHMYGQLYIKYCVSPNCRCTIPPCCRYSGYATGVNGQEIGARFPRR